MRFRLVPKSVILNDLERYNGRFCVILPNSVASRAHCVGLQVVEDVTVKSSRSLPHVLMSFYSFFMHLGPKFLNNGSQPSLNGSTKFAYKCMLKTYVNFLRQKYSP